MHQLPFSPFPISPPLMENHNPNPPLPLSDLLSLSLLVGRNPSIPFHGAILAVSHLSRRAPRTRKSMVNEKKSRRRRRRRKVVSRGWRCIRFESHRPEREVGRRENEEAAEIGYRVVGLLDPSENPFKPYDPVFAVVQV